MAQKLSTTAKKIIKLVNQTATGIYEDATSLNNETWFPGYSNSAPVESVVFKKTINDEADKIIKQVQGNLSDEDRNAVYNNTNSLLTTNIHLTKKNIPLSFYLVLLCNVQKIHRKYFSD